MIIFQKVNEIKCTEQEKHIQFMYSLSLLLGLVSLNGRNPWCKTFFVK